MKEEFLEVAEFMDKKYDYIVKNNTFDMNIKLDNKIYDNIIEQINLKREETLKKMSSLKDNYMKNIQQNISKIKSMIEKSDDVDKRLNEELNKMGKQAPFDFCRELLDS